MLVSFILTLLVLSFVLGDNPAFRFALEILVGSTAGYFAVILIRQVIAPKLIYDLLIGNYIVAAIPLILSVLLILRLIPRFSRIGNIPLAYLAGTGAAVVIGGAIFGTLMTQVSASATQFSSWKTLTSGEGGINFLEGLFVLFGTIAALLYFQFTLRADKSGSTAQPKSIETIRSAGKVFIIVTLGAVFAGVFNASVTALVSRLAFLWDTIRLLIG